jgi:hypothetical protein
MSIQDSRGSSVSIVTAYGLDDRGSIPDRGRGFFFQSSAPRPALGPTQPPVQWVPVVLSPGVKHGRGVMLTTHPCLVPMLRMSRSYTSSPPCASMACSGTAFIQDERTVFHLETCMFLLCLPLNYQACVAPLINGPRPLIQ